MGEACKTSVNRLKKWWIDRTRQMFEAQAKITLYPTETGAWRLRAQAYRLSWTSEEVWSDEDLDIQLREARLWVNRQVV